VGLDKGLQGLILPPVLAEIGVEAVEDGVPIPGPAL
jgi:hypothetical protein